MYSLTLMHEAMLYFHVTFAFDYCRFFNNVCTICQAYNAFDLLRKTRKTTYVHNVFLSMYKYINLYRKTNNCDGLTPNTS